MHIRECIESLLSQSQKANEIILIAHNCTDKTIDIVKQYPWITLYEYHTDEKWPIPARKYGFEKATWDIVACLDGDSYVSKNWLQEIIKPFKSNRINSVWWYPILLENPNISKIWFLQGLPILRNIFDFYFWWGNFACRKKDYEIMGGMDACKMIGDELNLYYPAEDCILSFLLKKRGELWFARKARSYVYPWRFFDGKNRNKKQSEDLKKIKKYFQNI